MALKKFLVLGAGVTGLTVARELLEKGEKVIVIEKTDNVGGLAQSQVINGISIDYGPHLFHTAHSEIIDYWRGLVGDSLCEKQFYAGILAGKFMIRQQGNHFISIFCTRNRDYRVSTKQHRISQTRNSAQLPRICESPRW